MAHHEPPHQDLHRLQMQLFSFSALRINMVLTSFVSVLAGILSSASNPTFLSLFFFRLCFSGCVFDFSMDLGPKQVENFVYISDGRAIFCTSFSSDVTVDASSVDCFCKDKI